MIDKADSKTIIIITLFVILGFLGGYLYGHSEGITEALNACVISVDKICRGDYLTQQYKNIESQIKINPELDIKIE